MADSLPQVSHQDPNQFMGMRCVQCRAVLSQENLAVATDKVAVCSTCVPKGVASTPPGMLM